MIKYKIEMEIEIDSEPCCRPSSIQGMLGRIVEAEGEFPGYSGLKVSHPYNEISVTEVIPPTTGFGEGATFRSEKEDAVFRVIRLDHRLYTLVVRDEVSWDHVKHTQESLLTELEDIGDLTLTSTGKTDFVYRPTMQWKGKVAL